MGQIAEIELSAPGKGFDGLRWKIAIDGWVGAYRHIEPGHPLDPHPLAFRMPRDLWGLVPAAMCATVYDPDIDAPPEPWCFVRTDRKASDGVRIYALEE